MMNSRHAVVAVVACGIGALFGVYVGWRSSSDVDRRLERAARELEAAHVALTNATAMPGGAGLAPGVRAADFVLAVRAAVKEELAATCPSGAASGTTASGAAGEVAVRTPEMIAAMDAGRTLISAARAQGRWGDEDAASLRDVLSHLDDKSTAEVLTSLTKAINLGELKVETAGPLL